MEEYAKNDAIVLSASGNERERFWKKVVKGDGCWLMPAVSNKGYGLIYLRRNNKNYSFSAHRVAKLWEADKPMLSAVASHHCGTKNCVRPDHIFWGVSPKSVSAQTVANADGPTGFQVAGKLTKLSHSDVLEIWHAFASGGVSANQIGKKYGVGCGVVYCIMERKTFKRVTQHLPDVDRKERKHGMWRGANSPWAKLNEDKVRDIRRRHAEGASAFGLAKKHGVSNSTVVSVLKGLTWVDVN